MQKFFTDKAKIFECTISVDGANIDETKTRLLLEFPNNKNLLFHGKMNKYGKCEFFIPALKEIDECEGKAILEVIAEQSYFESWKDDFKLETNKKVVVEVVDREEREFILDETLKPSIQVQIKEDVNEVQNLKPEPKKDIVNENQIYLKFKTYLNENNIRINSIIKNRETFFTLLREYKKVENVNNNEITSIVEELQREIRILNS